MYDRNGDMMCLLENKVEEYYKLMVNTWFIVICWSMDLLKER